MIGIGRVKTPTLAIVCRRELEIRSFVPEPYHEIVATAAVAAGRFQMRHAPKERIKTRGEAKAIAASAESLIGDARRWCTDQSGREFCLLEPISIGVW